MLVLCGSQGFVLRGSVVMAGWWLQFGLKPRRGCGLVLSTGTRGFLVGRNPRIFAMCAYQRRLLNAISGVGGRVRPCFGDGIIHE